MKFLFLCAIALFGCAPNIDTSRLDPDTASIFARQTADRAANSANALAVIARQTRDAKIEMERVRATEYAQQQFFVHATQTAAAQARLDAQAEKTDTARSDATAAARFATHAAQTPTARAIQTGTRVAEQIATATAIVVIAQTEAQQTRAAEVLKNEIAENEDRRAMQAATQDARRLSSFVSEAIGVLWLPVSGAIFVIILLFAIVRFVLAIITRIDAASAALLPAPVVITDRYGNPVGFIKALPRGGFTQETFENLPLLDAPQQIAPRTIDEQIEFANAEDSNSAEMLRVNSMGGDTYISRDTPEEAAWKLKKNLAMRLVRSAINYYVQRQVDPRSVTRIPGYRDLEWSADSWARAVESLKPYVYAKSGRGGGTFCGAEYPSLVRLYDAVGSDKIITPPHQVQNTSALSVSASAA